ncbi:unnamed protein product [Linum tenue]|uniref:Uncharacterized protein n=1 Tax=Linum tenue TaxID=586396 RepID=A0AAV0N9P4_9ROSI|nr:unnamed protein product [Linum tenue]
MRAIQIMLKVVLVLFCVLKTL